MKMADMLDLIYDVRRGHVTKYESGVTRNLQDVTQMEIGVYHLYPVVRVNIFPLGCRLIVFVL